MAPTPRSHIRDVAALAGVSVATVSRALNDHPNVAAPTRQRVLDAARELAYVVSPHASGLASGRTRAVAVVVPFVNRWFFSTVVVGVADVLAQHGYDAVLYHLANARDRDRFFERMPLARRVDGVLPLSMPLGDEHTLALRALDLPLVSVGSHMPRSASVRVDDVHAARTAVNHLVHQGHRRIGYIAGSQDDPGFRFESSRNRRRGFEEALRAAGADLDADLMAEGPFGVHGGAAAMARLLSVPEPPTAVVAEYDELAIGALWTLRRANIVVPHGMSVVGIDDHEMAEVHDLTTVRQDPAAQGAEAARLLLRAVAGDLAASEEDVVLPTSLVIRGSTAPL